MILWFSMTEYHPLCQTATISSAPDCVAQGITRVSRDGSRVSRTSGAFSPTSGPYPGQLHAGPLAQPGGVLCTEVSLPSWLASSFLPKQDLSGSLPSCRVSGLLLWELSATNRTKSSQVKSLSRVRLFTTPWTVAYQVPLSMGFSRQE